MLEQVQGPASDRWEAEVQLFIAILDMIVINNINNKANIIIFVKSTNCYLISSHYLLEISKQVGLVWQSGSGLISSESQERQEQTRSSRGQV